MGAGPSTPVRPVEHPTTAPQSLAPDYPLRVARQLLPDVAYMPRDLRLIAELTASYHVDGHRADIVILKAALANAAFNGRAEINESDILQAAELALPHRLKRHPFEDTETDLNNLQARLDEAQNRAQAEQERAAAGDGEKKT